MALFGKRKAAPAAIGVPTDRVLQMRQQNYSNDQIIQSLQQEGYSASQIFDAMSQADIKGAVGGEMPNIPAEQAQPQMQQFQPAPEMQMPSQMPMQMPEFSPMPAQSSVDRSMVEEIAESIVEEKWNELMKGVEKIIEWKETTENKLTKIEQSLKDLKERFEMLHSGVLGKISEYDQGIKGLGTDIKAMNEVFRKTLPTFTANINELSRLTKKVKAPGSKKE